MKLLILFFGLCFINTAYSQSDTTTLGYIDSVTFRPAEILPAFPGGEITWKKYLSIKLRYPYWAIDNKIEGDVIVQFKVDTDGKLSDIKLVKKVYPDLDKEALRLIKQSPKWVPAENEGKKIAYIHRVTIPFRLPINN